MLITAYRPDPERWSADFRVRRSRKRKTVEFVQASKYAAEVPIESIDEEGDWSPRISLEDAKNLETVRLALQRGDVAAAAKHGRVFDLLSVSA